MQEYFDDYMRINSDSLLIIRLFNSTFINAWCIQYHL
jgi:hypothetical protein